MKQEKADRRVRYTKLVLRESLLELMQEKSISRITSTELCRRADINRNTFYAHYGNPEELLHSIQNELFEKVRQSVEHSWSNGSMPAFLTEVCQVIYDNRDLCKTLFSDYGDKDFLRRIVDLAHDKSIAEWKAAGMKDDAEQLELLYAFSVNGSVAVIRKWIQGSMAYTPKEIAFLIEKTTFTGLQSFFNSQKASH